MKFKIYIFILFPVLVFSQNKVKLFNEINIAYTIPNQLENSFLKKGYKNDFGFLLEIEPITYKKFGFVGGILINQFKATNKSIAGNISTALRKEAYIKLVYHYNLIDKINVSPYIGFGLNQLKEIGKINGETYLVGTNINYNFYNDISFLVGLQYLYSKYNISTNTFEKDFFDSSSNLQLNFGFNFRFSTLEKTNNN